MNEVDILRKLLEVSSGACLTTRKLDEILLECWGNKHDAMMHCNSMMRRGLIDYEGDGDWLFFFTKEELDEID
jgi:hypothetical protein